ncbi:MAG: carboxynorspermidine decarboxylase [Lachnospiraceae bacterium]|nr:carboxynorspermidine decarboxylase [Lachnospiraceae bacterium]MEE1341322.1 carboxynorspermidine decarboxylase [Lachnospiraceae bacterium]
MDFSYFNQVSTPSYVIDERLLKANLEKLHGVMKETGCSILLAQKSFSHYGSYPLISKYLSGTTASGLFEAKLGKEYMGEKEVHIYSPAYKEEDFAEIMQVSDHIVFNSPTQWEKFKGMVADFSKKTQKKMSCGIRVNPEYAKVETECYNPCGLYSRLGVTKKVIDTMDLTGIEGLHFHTMCEQNSDVLAETLQVVEEKFSHVLPQMKWINFGGGHHITREDYDTNTLIKCIRHMQDTYGLKVYIEPGEAIALNAGFLVSTVLDIVENGRSIAILDTSAACHMPDVLEMPYRPEVIGAGKLGEKPYEYRFGGPTCLAGDIIGDYSFDAPLKVGDRVVFCDMAIYSMVKNNTFNGMPLPAIYRYSEEEGLILAKQFGYEDFKERL